ncbi:ATP-dependent Clp protease proteolytic subunit [Patescibacteria group bacterium AH-259-L07]|nr:ATP-dependent Clp protease proteolytic subunit [Patescibacteria group bacterium AH-259-L07]
MRRYAREIGILFLLYAAFNIVMLVAVRHHAYSTIRLVSKVDYQADVSGVIQIHGEIFKEESKRIIRELNVLENDPATDVIHISLDSPGGSAFGAIEICKAMKRCRKPIEIKSLEASSAAASILVSGTKGRRFVYEDSEIMIHRAIIIEGDNIFQTTSRYLLFYALMPSLYLYIETWNTILISAKTGQSIERVIKDLNNKTWFTAEEAVEYGFADSVIVHETKTQSLVR